MKPILNRIFLAFAALLSCNFMFAKPAPPPPTPIGPGEHVPIDNWLFPFLVLTLVFGLYKVYSLKKTSI